MTYEEMFRRVKEILSLATAPDLLAEAAMQITVTGDGSGIFYVKVADGTVDVQPYDYRDHDVSLIVDSATLLKALAERTADDLPFTGNPVAVDAVRVVLNTIPEMKEEVPAKKVAPKKTASKKAAAPKTEKVEKAAVPKTEKVEKVAAPKTEKVEKAAAPKTEKLAETTTAAPKKDTAKKSTPKK